MSGAIIGSIIASVAGALIKSAIDNSNESSKDSTKEGLSSGLSSAIGTTMSGVAQNQMNKDLLSYQSRLAQEQAENDYQRQIDFFNRQNDYNSPSAQYSRLMEAGLNPGAVMSGGGLFNTSQSNSSAPTSKISSQPMVSLNQQKSEAELALLRSMARKNNTEAGYIENGLLAKVWAEIELTSVQQSLLQAQTDGILTDTDLKEVELYIARQTMGTQIEYSQKELEYLTGNLAKLSSDTKLSDEMRKYYSAQSVLTYVQAAAQQANIRLTEAQIEKIATESKAIIQQMTITGERWTIDSKYLDKSWRVNLRNSQWSTAAEMVNAVSHAISASTDGLADLGSFLSGIGRIVPL